MKKEIKKNTKLILMSFVLIFIMVLTICVVSAGWFDRLKARITGKYTKSVNLNISVGGPKITEVYNETISLSSGPIENSATDITVNFTVYLSSGFGNLNHTSALANASASGEDLRQNTSCELYESDGNYANYTCNITLWWWDAPGVWTINTYIEDNQTNSVMNNSQDFDIGTRTGFVLGPGTLNWPGISPGGTNQTSDNDPLILNNTGNNAIGVDTIEINSSNLRGEDTPEEGLWADNFSVSWDTGDACSGDGCLECGGTVMERTIYTGITTANLTKGNYTINDGDTGQEKLYFCLRFAGTELSTQAYSSANETEWAWIVQIT